MTLNLRGVLEAARERMSWLDRDDPAACSMRACVAAFAKFHFANRSGIELLDLRRKVQIYFTAANQDEPFRSRIDGDATREASWRAVLCEYTWVLAEEPEILARWEDDGGRAPDSDEVRRRVLDAFPLEIGPIRPHGEPARR